MWNVPKEWAPHFRVWQALITEVTVWTSRRITVIVLPESKERGGPAGEITLYLVYQMIP